MQPDALPAISRELIELAGSRRCWALYAPMGSGKTTLIKALCNALDVKDLVNSPTFSIVQTYHRYPGDEPVYHMDWYRIQSTQEAIDTGIQEILENDSVYRFIEWPENAEELLPELTFKLHIEILNEQERLLYINN